MTDTRGGPGMSVTRQRRSLPATSGAVTAGLFERPLPEANVSLPTGLQRQMVTAILPGGDRSVSPDAPTLPQVSAGGGPSSTLTG